MDPPTDWTEGKWVRTWRGACKIVGKDLKFPSDVEILTPERILVTDHGRDRVVELGETEPKIFFGQSDDAQLNSVIVSRDEYLFRPTAMALRKKPCKPREDAEDSEGNHSSSL